MAKKRTKRRKAKKSAGSKRGGYRRKASGMNMPSREPVLSHLTSYRQQLLAQQAQLQHELDTVSDAIGALGGAAAVASAGRRAVGRPAGRGVREGSLKSYILRVMPVGEVMAVKDVAAAVRRAGYSTNSNNFPNQVSNALAQTPGVSKMSRGKFKRTS